MLEKMLEIKKKMASNIFVIRKKIAKWSFIRGLFVYEWEMRNPHTLKSCDVTSFRDHKSIVKPMKNHATPQFFPL